MHIKADKTHSYYTRTGEVPEHLDIEDIDELIAFAESQIEYLLE